MRKMNVLEKFIAARNKGLNCVYLNRDDMDKVIHILSRYGMNKVEFDMKLKGDVQDKIMSLIESECDNLAKRDADVVKELTAAAELLYRRVDKDKRDSVLPFDRVISIIQAIRKASQLIINKSK